jgi:hypothetical protein
VSVFGWITKLFAKPAPPPQVRKDDPDFGPIIWNAHFVNWMMEDTWALASQPEPVRCIEIPGGRDGPSPAARRFLLDLKARPERAWACVDATLRAVMDERPRLRGQSPRNVFHIDFFGMDGEAGPDWAVGLEARDGDEWLEIHLDLVGDAVVRKTLLVDPVEAGDVP